MGKRHDPPTDRQLLERIYRRQIASDEKMAAQQRTIRVLINHCHRLVDEKQLLLDLLPTELLLELAKANDFMAEPLHTR